MKRPILQLLLLAVISSSAALGQINCLSGSASNKLVCQFPFSTGVLTNASSLGGSGAQSAIKTATAINTGIATQVSQLPLASASAGTVEVYKNGIYETFNNLGPILVDRAQTIGKGKVFIGGTFSQFVFTKIDGISLGNLPFAYSQNAYSPSGQLQSTIYTSETTNLSFRMNQFVGVATVGITNRIDFSVIVPIERVSVGSTAFNSKSYVQSVGSSTAVGPVSNPNIYTNGTASGIGDVNFNVKSVLQKGERATFSAGFTLRAPTGDDLNLLGSGSFGFNPYVVYSYLAKISPHAKIGYQWNTNSELNNPTLTAGGNRALPGGLNYDIGADWALARRVTVAADLLGNQYLNTPTYVATSSSITTTSGTQTLASSTVGNQSYTVSNLSTGAKFNLFKSVVLSANVLTQLNDSGLHSRPTPLLGISARF
ncbi:MAG TPA: hypothetical protein VHD85_20135 [Terracidiphilus sp.]|jgi:hypothetical protein|nr:hypothetical protein [Terracidiphilus sp.]